MQLCSEDGDHSLSYKLERQLSRSLRSDINYNIDEAGFRSVNVGVVWRGIAPLILRSRVVLHGQGMAGNCSVTYLAPGLSTTFICNLSGRGVKLDTHLMGRVSPFTELGLGLSVALHELALTLNYKRFGHTLQIPIRLSDAPDALTIAGVSLVCFLGVIGTYVGLVRPHNREALVQSMVRRAKKTGRQRSRAIKQRQMLHETAVAKAMNEGEKGGLVIHLAIFGVLPDAEILRKLQNMPSEERWIAAGATYTDVTLAVQNMVDAESRLHLDVGLETKARLPGWFDPCPEKKEKQLYMAYSWQHQTYSHVFDGDDEIGMCAGHSEAVSGALVAINRR